MTDQQKIDLLRNVLQRVSSTIENSENWWMDCPGKGGFDLEEINKALEITE